jgi:multiple sugar transport system permease protein
MEAATINRNFKKRVPPKELLLKIGIYLLLIVGLLSTILPLFWMISTSFKSQEAIFEIPPRLIPKQISFENYINLFKQEIDFAKAFQNTLIVTVSYTIGALLIPAMAAYAFSKLRFPGRDLLFMIFLATMMIPSQVTLIPNYLSINFLGWLNTYRALIIPPLANVFNIFFLRQYMLGIPNELCEVARIDGASEGLIFFKIIIPLLKPALATLGILNFTGMWRDFLWPAIIATDSSMYTLQVALYTLFGQNQASTTFGVVMAGAVLVLLPLFLIFLAGQKFIVKGISTTGIKG